LDEVDPVQHSPAQQPNVFAFATRVPASDSAMSMNETQPVAACVAMRATTGHGSFKAVG